MMIRFVLAFLCLLVASSVTQAAARKSGCPGGVCPNPAFASSSYTIVEQAAPATAPVSKAAVPVPMPSGSYVPKAVPKALPVGPPAAAPASRTVTVSQGSSRGGFFQRPIFHPFRGH